MSLSRCNIDWNANATLHKRVWGPSGPVQMGHGGPVAHGSFVGMIRRALAADPVKQRDLSVTVDAHAAGGHTWLEIEHIREIAQRPDYPTG